MSSQVLCTDVLALCCTDNFIFAGIGCSLYLYDAKNFEFQVKIDCLEPQNIHGIVKNPNTMLTVFGGKSFCAYTVSCTADNIAIDTSISKQEAPDWIITVKWSTIGGSDHLCLLLAHNNVCIYNPDQKVASYKTFSCTEKCLLYAGYISVKDNGNLIIFSGTVFQEILIWEVDHSCSDEASVLHHLKGHNGVIFSVIYDEATKLVCSTSDDRTVRLWKVNDKKKKGNNVIDWREANVTLMKTMFGHTARVWRCIIRNKSLITIGEDSLMCTWSLDGKLLNKLTAHYGAAIWSIDITNDNQHVITGGADGAIHEFPIFNVLNSVPSSRKYTCPSPKYVCYLWSGKFLVFSENGTLYVFDKKRSNPQKSFHMEKYSDYCVMKVSPCHSYVCFASKDGYVTIYQDTDRKLKRIFEKKIMESKIFSIHWLRTSKIILCGMNGVLKIFDFTLDGSIMVEAVCVLPASRERWLTAAVIYYGLLICGDRSGSMHVFELEELTPCNEADVFETDNKPVQTFAKVHGTIGVQTLMIYYEELISAGRDGTLRFYTLSKTKSSLCALHEEKMPMDWIAGHVNSRVSEMYIFGFQEADFIIYNYNHLYCHRVAARIPCGGGHRSWDCVVSQESVATFLYIRDKQIFLSDFSLKSFLPSLLAVRNGYHTKEIHCIKPLLNTDRCGIFISGSEDTTLRIFCTHISDYGDPFTHAVLDGHVSSIKFVTYLNLPCNKDSRKKYLIFSGGGRAQIKVWKIDVNLDTIKYMLLRRDFTCRDITSHMLYGSDQERKKQSQESAYNMDPETRYMDIDTYRYGTNYVLLFVACADGFVRIFLYDISAETISIKLETKCASRCITKIAVLTSGEKVFAVIMSTDGICRFIDFTIIVSEMKSKPKEQLQNRESFSPIAQFNLHQSGINSYDIKSIAKDDYLLATGGDDNLFNIIRLKIESSSETKISLLSKWSSSDAHVAQITGIMFHKKNIVFTAGIDQLVNIYKYDYTASLNARILKKVHTSVADIKGLISWSNPNGKSFVCVYGKGFEILEIPVI